MPFILNIDTALDVAAICVADGENVLDVRTNDKQIDHASWIHTAIHEMLAGLKLRMNQLNAVAVTSGPGSYTGLRVGMATAKGICFALNVPLITETTLKLIAYALRNESPEAALVCPMIDARRMEVYTAVYDRSLNEATAPFALILDEQSFENELQNEKVIFAGNGSEKWKTICHHHNAVFSTSNYGIKDLALISASKFTKTQFTSLAYSEPFYIKSFYTGSEKVM